MSRIAPDVVSAVQERSAGYCELGGMLLRGKVDLHHRRLRSQGGRDEAVNLLLAHHACHMSAHQHPARSYELGHLVASWNEPGEVAVRLLPGLCARR